MAFIFEKASPNALILGRDGYSIICLNDFVDGETIIRKLSSDYEKIKDRLLELGIEVTVV